MGKEIIVPVLSYEDLRKKADSFLAQFHPESSIPIPIEEIIEFQMGLNIFPMPGLGDLLEAEGFISSDLKTITVNEYIYENNKSRYRFTLAHEVGHLWLHENLYRSHIFDSIEEWKEFVQGIPDDNHNWFEWQAYSFAGLLLVPREPLIAEVTSNIELIEKEGISLEKNWDIAWDYIYTDVAKAFSVSAQVIEKRVGKDKLKERFGGK